VESSSRFTASVKGTIPEAEGWPRVGYLGPSEETPLGSWVVREVEISRDARDLTTICIHMSAEAVAVSRREALRIAWWLIKAVFSP
jgi:hypothetical protein